MPSFGPHDSDMDQTPEELFRQGDVNRIYCVPCSCIQVSMHVYEDNVYTYIDNNVVGQEAFARAIALWERGLGQVSEAQGSQQVHPQLAVRLRNILRHAYTVQDVYEHVR